jgi:GTP-binding protein
MPGYGFAQAPKARVDEWTGLVRSYLRGRPTLARVFVLIDARHGLKPPDRSVMELMDQAAVSYQAVLTKIDKVKPAELAQRIATTDEELRRHAAAYPGLLATSAQTGFGIAELRAQIAQLVAS